MARPWPPPPTMTTWRRAAPDSSTGAASSGDRQPVAQQAENGITAHVPDSSAFDDVHGQAAARRLLVFGLHVGSRLAHGLDDGVQRHVVLAVALSAMREALMALIAPMALRSMQESARVRRPGRRSCPGCAPCRSRPRSRPARACRPSPPPCRGHGAGHPDLALAADLGARDRRGFLCRWRRWRRRSAGNRRCRRHSRPARSARSNAAPPGSRRPRRWSAR